jgi:hypothetical protein
VNVARALIGCPPVVAPAGVLKPMMAAFEKAEVSRITNSPVYARRRREHPRCIAASRLKETESMRR